MNVTTAAQSSSAIYTTIAALSRNKASGTTTATNAVATGSTVNISSAAREAAKNDSRLKLPDYVSSWFNKDFSPEVIDEAKARLADIKANGELGAGGPINLPLLPENQKLQDSFRAEMKEISRKGMEYATPEQSQRYNLLMNLNMRLQLVGWQQPMTEADVQREFDISAVMAKLSNESPKPAATEEPEVSREQLMALMQSDTVPAVWTSRWDKAGLTMPTEVTLSRERPMWLDLASAAGIGGDEFVTQARRLAQEFKGSALTKAIETFISERYVAFTAEQSQSLASR